MDDPKQHFSKEEIIMSHKLALFWQHTERHPVARVDVGQIRQLLQILTSRSIFPTPAIHCDERVQARDISITGVSLAQIALAINAADDIIQIIEEAQFTRSKLRILTCPITNTPLLAVSPIIDIDIPNNYFEHIKQDIAPHAHAYNWANGSIRLQTLIERIERRTRGLLFSTFDRAKTMIAELEPYLPGERTVLLRWQAAKSSAAPTEPVYPWPTTSSHYVLDPGTGRMFGSIDNGKTPLQTCICGPQDQPSEWDRVVIINDDLTTDIIAKFEPGPPAQIVFDFHDWRAHDLIEYHHDAATPQPSLHLRETLYA